LVIEISPDVQPGQYNFGIGIEIDGKDYGTIPCTINVVGNIPEFQYSGNHGITTTKVEPKPGDNVTMSSTLMTRLTLDELVEKSDTVVTGKVVDIHPARYETETLASSFLTIFTDVIIQTEFYLYGEPQSTYIAVRVMGGRVGEKMLCVEDEPVFNLGEETVMFLTRIDMLTIPPEGIAPVNYYRVTGAMQGKLGYKDGHMVNLEGDSSTVSEIEQKIASMHGGK